MKIETYCLFYESKRLFANVLDDFFTFEGLMLMTPLGDNLTR